MGSVQTPTMDELELEIATGGVSIRVSVPVETEGESLTVDVDSAQDATRADSELSQYGADVTECEPPSESDETRTLSGHERWRDDDHPDRERRIPGQGSGMWDVLEILARSDVGEHSAKTLFDEYGDDLIYSSANSLGTALMRMWEKKLLDRELHDGDFYYHVSAYGYNVARRYGLKDD